MQLIPEIDILTIVGNWNPAIITHDWVSKYLLPDKNLKVEYPRSIIGASLRISTDDLRLYVSPGRFNFSIIRHSDSMYKKIGEIALELANYLMHTPVSSFGLNYVYESNITDTLDEIFSIPDAEKMKQLGLEAELTEIKRRFNFQNHALNFTVLKLDKYKFDFNYDFKVKSLVEFKDKFEPQKLIEFKNHSKELLLELYDIKGQ